MLDRQRSNNVHPTSEICFQAKFLTSWPLLEALRVQYFFCFRQAIFFGMFQKHYATDVFNFACQAMFERFAIFPKLLVKHCFYVNQLWQHFSTLRNFLEARRSCLCINFVVPKCLTAIILDKAKWSNICCKTKSYFKCWTNRVWSFGQGLKKQTLFVKHTKFVYQDLCLNVIDHVTKHAWQTKFIA